MNIFGSSTLRLVRTLALIPALALATILVGCGGGGGGGGGGAAAPAADGVAPTVSTTYPLDTANGASITAAITATFSEPLNPATVTAGTFLVDGDSGPVAGSVSLSGDGLEVHAQPRAGAALLKPLRTSPPQRIIRPIHSLHSGYIDSAPWNFLGMAQC